MNDMSNTNSLSKNERVERIKQARQEILNVPTEHMTGEELAPSGYTIMPSRACNDARLHKRPQTLIILMALCSYANSYSGMCFPSQALLSKRLGKSQQAISKHIKLLVEYGYVEILRKGSSLRKKNKTSLYRIVYDPAISADELQSMELSMSEDKQREEAQKTLDSVNQDFKNEPVDNFPNNDKHTTQSGCISAQPNEVVCNSLALTNKNTSRDLAIKLCECYAHRCDTILNSRGNWRWDERQINIAIDMIDAGVTLQQFDKTVTSSLRWHKKQMKRPPFSLAFYKDSFKEKKEVTEMSVQELVNDTVKGLRISKIYKI